MSETCGKLMETPTVCWHLFLSDTHFVLAVRNQIKLTTDFESHKRPSGANNATNPVKWGRVGEGGYWQQPGNKLLTPFSYFPCGESFTAGKQRPAIRRKLLPRFRKNDSHQAFPIQSPKLHFWVTVGEKKALQQPERWCCNSLTWLMKKGEFCCFCFLPFGRNQIWLEDKQAAVALWLEINPMRPKLYI